ncbi:hypothetical protein BGZ50_005818 [Haplosporangium sp. Z 11]|nr:hypothetical protein BGZ50_005818 [Haplosporangium sp. Z 11]
MSQTSSAQNKALALPEIRLHIGHFLTLHEHLQCLQVNKAWYGTFIALLWEGPLLIASEDQGHYSHDGRNNTVIPISAMQSNATHVHSLQLVSRVPHAYLEPEALCNLRALSISQGMTKVPLEDEYWQLLTRLIRKNSYLHDITLSRATPHSEATIGFWNAIVQAPQIKELHVYGYNEHYNSSEGLWNVCSNATSLESFSLNGAIFIGSKTIERLAQYPDFATIKRLKIQKIDVHDNPHHFNFGNVYFPQSSFLPNKATTPSSSPSSVTGIAPAIATGLLPLFIVQKCPNLYDLYFDMSVNDQLPKNAFIKSVESGTWKQLCRIQLKDAAFMDEELTRIIKALETKQLNMLHIPHSAFGPISLASLFEKSYDQTLTVLNIQGSSLFRNFCDTVSSPIFQTILGSFPNLQSFAGDVLLASDIAKGCAWGCTRLKELRIDIEIDFDPDETIMRKTLSTQQQPHHAINDKDVNRGQDDNENYQANNKAAEAGEKAAPSRDPGSLLYADVVSVGIIVKNQAGFGSDPWTRSARQLEQDAAVELLQNASTHGSGCEMDESTLASTLYTIKPPEQE